MVMRRELCLPLDSIITDASRFVHLLQLCSPPQQKQQEGDVGSIFIADLLAFLPHTVECKDHRSVRNWLFRLLI